MWKAAFTGRSETGSVSGRSSSHRKKSRADSETDGVSRRPEGERRKSEKSRSSMHGDDDSAYVTAPSSRVGEPRSLTESAVRAFDRDGDDWEDEDKDARSERKSVRSDGKRRVRRSEKERSRSRDRKDDKKSRGSRTEAESSRGKSRKTDRESERGMPEVGSFEQFPGQSGDSMMGPVGEQNPMMSGALPSANNQFGLSRADSYGAAAEYYNDEGQSVGFQPGRRATTPNMLVNPDLHLHAATASPHPVEDTGQGSAADFYSGKISPDTQPNASAKKTPSKRSWRSTRAVSPSGVAAAEAASAAGTARGEADSYYSNQDMTSTSYQQQQQAGSNSANRPPQYGPNRYNSDPTTGAYYAPPQQQHQNPNNSGKQSTNSNAGLYTAAGASAAAAGLAGSTMNQHNRPPSYAPYTDGGASTQHQHFHEHKGPMTRLKDGLLNLISSEEDVIKMEMYTEYIGVCKYCFDPRTSPYDAPRNHHYHSSSRRDSFEELRKRRSVDRMRREGLGRSGSKRVDKDARYYSSDKRRSGSKTDLVGAGLAAAGVAAGANAIFNNGGKDFDDTYSVKSGHRENSVVRRRSRSSSRERRRRSEHGVVGKDGREEFVTVRTKDGRVERRRVHRSRSGSRDRKTGLMTAAAGAALGAGAVAASRRNHDHSPNGTRIRRRSRSHSGSRSPQQGLFGGFFSPSQRSSNKRRNSGSRSRKERRKKKQGAGGFFNFGNGSISSSSSDGYDGGMAFGDAFSSKSNLPLRRKSSTRSTKGKARRSSDEHIAATVAGFSATAAALAAAQKGQKVGHGNGRPELGAKKESFVVQGGRRVEGEDEWEDELPSDVDDASSVGSGLAFGAEDEHRMARKRQSMESIGSQSSGDGGLSAWGWRWGGKDKKKRRRPSPPRHDSSAFGAAAAGAAGVAAMDRPSHAESSSSIPQRPMEYVDPRPISEASSRHASMPGAFDSSETGLPVIRPGPGPIQHPKPVAPIQPAFTKEHVDLDDDERFAARPKPRRAQSSPPPTSSLVKDAALIGAAALGTAGIIASQGRKGKDGVRFGLTEEQERKQRREQERVAEEERRREERERKLREEAGRFTREQDILRGREEENKRAAEAKLEKQRAADAELDRQRAAQREADEQAEMDRQRKQERREREDARNREQARQAKEEERRRQQEREQQERDSQMEVERERSRFEEQQRSERDRRTSGPERREPEQRQEDTSQSSSSVPWRAVAAGAAAAGVGAYAISEHERNKNREPDDDRGRTPHWHYRNDREQNAPYAAQEITPEDSSFAMHESHRRASEPVLDDDIFDPQLFKKRDRSQSDYARHAEIARKAAAKVVAEDQDKDEDAEYDRWKAAREEWQNAPAKSQAEFFTPEILNQTPEGKTKVADPVGDNNVQVFNADDDSPRAKFMREHAVAASGRTKHAPYGVPQLSLISPTPPQRASPPLEARRKGVERSHSPLAQAQEPEQEVEDDIYRQGSESEPEPGRGNGASNYRQSSEPEAEPQHEDDPATDRRSSLRRGVSWGADQTHVYDVPTPESYRDSYIDDQDARNGPGKAEAAAGVAAGSVAAGIAAHILNNESSSDDKGRFKVSRDDEEDVEDISPYRDDETPSYERQQYFEPSFDTGLGRFGMDSPGTEGAPPVQGFVEGETEEPTPSEEKAMHVPGGFDDEEEALDENSRSSSQRENTRKPSAEDKVAGILQEVQATEPEPEYEASWEPQLSKKDKKKREKAAKRSSTLDNEPTNPAIEQTAPTATEPVEEAQEEPDHFLSKKDKKKRDKAAKRTSTFESEPSTPAAEMVEPTSKELVSEPQEDPDYFLSKKDRKKQEKAAKRTISGDQFSSMPIEEPSLNIEPEPEAEEEPAWEPPLSKKDKKKREKEAKKQGFADVAGSVMTAGGIAAVAAAAASEKDTTESSDGKKSKKGKKKGQAVERDIRDIEPEDAISGEPSGMPGGWDTDKEEKSTSLPETDLVDPFQYQVHDEPSQSTPSQEADAEAEWADSKKSKSKSKKQRKSVNFDEPAVSSPLRSQVEADDYMGESGAPSAEVVQETEPAPTTNGHDSRLNGHDDLRSVASEPTGDRESRRGSKNKKSRRDSEYYEEQPDPYDDDRSVAASEPADAHGSDRKSKRRSRGEDDDTASVTSTRSRREKEESSSKQDKKGGFFGMFSRKSSDAVPTSKDASRDVTKETSNDANEDSERRQRRKKRADSEYGDDDDDLRSTASESKQRRRRSRDDRDEDTRSRYDDDDDDDTRRRHHHKRRTDEDDYSTSQRQSDRRRTDDEANDKDQSFLDMRVEDLPPLPDSRPTSPDSTLAKQEQGHGNLASAVTNTDSPGRQRQHVDAFNLVRQAEHEHPASNPWDLVRHAEHEVHPASTAFDLVHHDQPGGRAPKDAFDPVRQHKEGEHPETTAFDLVRHEEKTKRPAATAFDLLRQDQSEGQPRTVGDSGARDPNREAEWQAWRDENNDLPALPDSRPSSPTGYFDTETPQRRKSLQRLQSSTAVPLRFPFGHQPLTPGARMERAASFGGSLPQSPASPVSAQKSRQGRPMSTEIRPLYLVERNRKTPEVEEALPSLPSSVPSSRAASMVDSDEYASAAEDWGSPQSHKNQRLETSEARGAHSDEEYLDSGQTTPRATEFAQEAVDRPPRQEPQFYTWEDFEQDERMHNTSAEQSVQADQSMEHTESDMGDHPQRPLTAILDHERTEREHLPPSSNSPRSQAEFDSTKAATGVATAAALEGAAALGYHALNQQDVREPPACGEDHVTQSTTDRIADDGMEKSISEMSGPESSQNVAEVEAAEAPSLSRKGSSKKKKGKKGRRAAKEDFVGADTAVAERDDSTEAATSLAGRNEAQGTPPKKLNSFWTSEKQMEEDDLNDGSSPIDGAGSRQLPSEMPVHQTRVEKDALSTKPDVSRKSTETFIASERTMEEGDSRVSTRQDDIADSALPHEEGKRDPQTSEASMPSVEPDLSRTSTERFVESERLMEEGDTSARLDTTDNFTQARPDEGDGFLQSEEKMEEGTAGRASPLVVPISGEKYDLSNPEDIEMDDAAPQYGHGLDRPSSTWSFSQEAADLSGSLKEADATTEASGAPLPASTYQYSVAEPDEDTSRFFDSEEQMEAGSAFPTANEEHVSTTEGVNPETDVDRFFESEEQLEAGSIADATAQPSEHPSEGIQRDHDAQQALKLEESAEARPTMARNADTQSLPTHNVEHSAFMTTPQREEDNSKEPQAQAEDDFAPFAKTEPTNPAQDRAKSSYDPLRPPLGDNVPPATPEKSREQADVSEANTDIVANANQEDHGRFAADFAPKLSRKQSKKAKKKQKAALPLPFDDSEMPEPVEQESTGAGVKEQVVVGGVTENEQPDLDNVPRTQRAAEEGTTSDMASLSEAMQGTADKHEGNLKSDASTRSSQAEATGDILHSAGAPTAAGLLIASLGSRQAIEHAKNDEPPQDVGSTNQPPQEREFDSTVNEAEPQPKQAETWEGFPIVSRKKSKKNKKNRKQQEFNDDVGETDSLRDETAVAEPARQQTPPPQRTSATTAEEVRNETTSIETPQRHGNDGPEDVPLPPGDDDQYQEQDESEVASHAQEMHRRTKNFEELYSLDRDASIPEQFSATSGPEQDPFRHEHASRQILSGPEQDHIHTSSDKNQRAGVPATTMDDASMVALPEDDEGNLDQMELDHAHIPTQQLLRREDEGYFPMSSRDETAWAPQTMDVDGSVQREPQLANLVVDDTEPQYHASVFAESDQSGLKPSDATEPGLSTGSGPVPAEEFMLQGRDLHDTEQSSSMSQPMKEHQEPVASIPQQEPEDEFSWAPSSKKKGKKGKKGRQSGPSTPSAAANWDEPAPRAQYHAGPERAQAESAEKPPMVEAPTTTEEMSASEKPTEEAEDFWTALPSKNKKGKKGKRALPQTPLEEDAGERPMAEPGSEHRDDNLASGYATGDLAAGGSAAFVDAPVQADDGNLDDAPITSELVMSGTPSLPREEVAIDDTFAEAQIPSSVDLSQESAAQTVPVEEDEEFWTAPTSRKKNKKGKKVKTSRSESLQRNDSINIPEMSGAPQTRQEGDLPADVDAARSVQTNTPREVGSQLAAEEIDKGGSEACTIESGASNAKADFFSQAEVQQSPVDVERPQEQDIYVEDALKDDESSIAEEDQAAWTPQPSRKKSKKKKQFEDVATATNDNYAGDRDMLVTTVTQATEADDAVKGPAEDESDLWATAAKGKKGKKSRKSSYAPSADVVTPVNEPERTVESVDQDLTADSGITPATSEAPGDAMEAEPSEFWAPAPKGKKAKKAKKAKWAAFETEDPQTEENGQAAQSGDVATRQSAADDEQQPRDAVPSRLAPVHHSDADLVPYSESRPMADESYPPLPESPVGEPESLESRVHGYDGQEPFRVPMETENLQIPPSHHEEGLKDTRGMTMDSRDEQQVDEVSMDDNMETSSRRRTSGGPSGIDFSQSTSEQATKLGQAWNSQTRDDEPEPEAAESWTGKAKKTKKGKKSKTLTAETWADHTAPESIPASESKNEGTDRTAFEAAAATAAVGAAGLVVALEQGIEQDEDWSGFSRKRSKREKRKSKRDGTATPLDEESTFEPTKLDDRGDAADNMSSIVDRGDTRDLDEQNKLTLKTANSEAREIDPVGVDSVDETSMETSAADFGETNLTKPGYTATQCAPGTHERLAPSVSQDAQSLESAPWQAFDRATATDADASGQSSHLPQLETSSQDEIRNVGPDEVPHQKRYSGESPITNRYQDLDFAATVAAGLADSGFNPDMVVSDPAFQRRASPPGTVPGEADPQEVFATVNKKRKGKKNSRTIEEASGEMESFAPSKQQDPQQSADDFDETLQKSLAETGFDPGLVHQTADSSNDTSSKEVIEDPTEFSFATSKRKKGKKTRKAQQWFEDDTTASTAIDDVENETMGTDAAIDPSAPTTQKLVEHYTQPSENVKSPSRTMAPPIPGSWATTNEDDRNVVSEHQPTGASNQLYEQFPRETNAFGQITETKPEPAVGARDVGSNFGLAGDGDMDVDEMDKAYKMFKKNKRNKRKQKAASQATDSAPETPATEEESGLDNVTTIDSDAQELPSVPETPVREQYAAFEANSAGIPEVSDNDIAGDGESQTLRDDGLGRKRHEDDADQTNLPSQRHDNNVDNASQRAGETIGSNMAAPGLVAAGVAASAGLGYAMGKSASMHRNRSTESMRSGSDRSLGLLPGDHQKANTMAPTWSFAKLDEGEPLPESPVLGSKAHEVARDSGYQELSSPLLQRHSVESTNRGVPEIHTSRSHESLSSRRSQEPLHISTETGSGWDLNVPKQRDTADVSQTREALHARTPSKETPLEATTRNRASYLFQSTPETLKDIPAPSDPPTPSQKPESSDYFRTRTHDSVSDAEPDLHEVASNASDRAAFSPPPAGTTSPRPALGTIIEERYGPKRTISDTGVREPENVKAIRRTATPQSIRARERALSPTILPPIRTTAGHGRSISNPMSTDEIINRLSWPSVDEDSGTVNIDRALKRKSSRHASADMRSPSSMSNRSNMSAGQFKSPQELRSFSRTSNRSSTPTLRRVDRSLSGDLRAASRRGDSGSAVSHRSSNKTIPFEPPPTPPSNDDELMDAGASRSANMSDVYHGVGDAQASQVSPTRPPSMRKRQSMHIVDLESRLNQLTAENEALQEARQAKGGSERDGESWQETLNARDLQLQERDHEISQMKAMLQPMQDEIARLTGINGELTQANRNMVDEGNSRFAALQQEHAHAHEQWQSSSRELESVRQDHGRLTTGMNDIVETEIAARLADKNSEIRQLREELDVAAEKIRALQVQIQSSKGRDFLTTRDEDYFDGACQKLCQHVQQWVLRFSKVSDNRVCRLSDELQDEKIEARLDNAILDGSDVDTLLKDRIKRRDVFMSVVMTIVWEFVFTRYLFGLEREQRQKLKVLSKQLEEVGPPRAIAQWRATTLTLLSKRQGYPEQRDKDTAAVTNEAFDLLCALLPPPSHAEEQLLTSLQRVISIAVDLSIEMRTQRADYIMLPPLQPEYDTNGDLVRKVHFNASLMNERSGMFSSNQELEQSRAVVKIVLFPLVVKKGDEFGEGEEEIVVCPAQVLVHNENSKGKRIVRVQSGAMEIDDPRRSRGSLISAQEEGTPF